MCADRLVGRLEDAVEELHLVEDAERPALLARAVVGEDEHERVVELAGRGEVVDEATDLVVGVVEERGERLLQARRELPLVLGQLVPRLDARVARRELGARGHDAQLELAGEPPLARDVPARVEPAPVLLHVLGRRLVRRVRRAEREVAEERAVGTHGARVVDELDRVVDQVLAQVVAVLGARGRVDAVVVVGEVGGVLVGLAFEEPVEAVEPALQRPLVVRAGRRTRRPSGTGATCRPRTS